MTPFRIEPAIFWLTAPPSPLPSPIVYIFNVERISGLTIQCMKISLVASEGRYCGRGGHSHAASNHMQMQGTLHIKRALNKRSYCYYLYHVHALPSSILQQTGFCHICTELLGPVFLLISVCLNAVNMQIC